MIPPVQQPSPMQPQQPQMMQPPVPMPPPPPPPLHNVKFRLTRKVSQVRVQPVPPDEFLIARRAISIESAPFICHRVRRTQSELIEMGFSESEVSDLPTADEPEYTPERIERFSREDEWPFRNAAMGIDPAMREIWLNETYVKCDYNNDGKVEWRKVLGAGTSGNFVLLKNEEWELSAPPFFDLTPIRMPHKVHGMSLADQVLDLQFIRSTLTRQALDNLYLSVAPRMIVQETTPDSVNYDDLLRVTPGGIIRTKGGATVTPVAMPFVAGEAFQMLEYLETVRENRTGIPRINQGIDSDTLNKTATGASLLHNAGKARIEMIARMFAETGIKRLFKHILEMVCKYQDKPATIRLRGEWVSMDPREWDDQMDMVVSVGLGTGNKDQQLQHLTTIAQFQEKMLMGGLSNMVTPENLYNTASQIVINAGLKSPEQYFTDPKNAPPQQQQPKPDPEMMKAQAKIQADQQAAQVQGQIQQQKLQHEMELARAKMEMDGNLQQQKMTNEVQMQRERMAADIQLKQQELQMEAVLKREQMMMPGHAPAETAIEEQEV